MSHFTHQYVSLVLIIISVTVSAYHAQSHTCDKLVLRAPMPVVNISVPATSSWDKENTSFTLENLNLTLDMECEAPFPIQWIESYDKVSHNEVIIDVISALRKVN